MTPNYLPGDLVLFNIPSAKDDPRKKGPVRGVILELLPLRNKEDLMVGWQYKIAELSRDELHTIPETEVNADITLSKSYTKRL